MSKELFQLVSKESEKILNHKDDWEKRYNGLHNLQKIFNEADENKINSEILELTKIPIFECISGSKLFFFLTFF